MSGIAEQECGSLWEALGRVRDHRRREGQRYSLAGLLLIAVAALLAGGRAGGINSALSAGDGS